MPKTNKTEMVTLTLKKSLSGRKKSHIACARGLGLRRIHHTVQVMDTPENRGMIREISYLIAVEGQA
jgi:large subunit ribosomal protein L30